MSVQSALDFARARIGYRAPDDPEPGSEAGRWMAAKLGQPWLAGPSTSIWWCACFVSMCVYEGGGSLPGGPQFNTDSATAAARAAGQLVDKASARAGDVAIFDWNFGTVSTDHTGLIESVSASAVTCIEGNTSSGMGGSQSAGNGVWRRTRSWSDVRFVIRPSYGDATPAQSVPAQAGLKVDGLWGSDTSHCLQEVLGTTADGEISSQDISWQSQNLALTTGWEWVSSDSAEGSECITALQRVLGVDDDGLIGPTTIRALQTRMGTPVDGHLDDESSCVMQFQKHLNQGRI
jgi:hypothetical protein